MNHPWRRPEFTTSPGPEHSIGPAVTKVTCINTDLVCAWIPRLHHHYCYQSYQSLQWVVQVIGAKLVHNHCNSCRVWGSRTSRPYIFLSDAWITRGILMQHQGTLRNRVLVQPLHGPIQAQSGLGHLYKGNWPWEHLQSYSPWHSQPLPLVIMGDSPSSCASYQLSYVLAA